MKYVLAPFALVGGVIVLVLVAWLLFFATKVSPGNVQEQWRFAYDYDASLRAISRQVCAAEVALEAAQSDDERIQRQSQLLAYQNNYERVKGEYDAHLRDAFRAGLIRPHDVPKEAPSLVAMKAQECSP